MYKDTVTLISIIKEVYEQKKSIDKYIVFDKDFEKNTKKKLNGIAEGLGINIKNYMVGKNNYKIPKIVADILVVYLTEESKKGSFISKINNKDYEKITKKEKVEFLDKIVEDLKEKYKNEENYSEILNSILEIKYVIMNEINFSHGGLELIDEIKKEMIYKIDECFKEFTDIKPDDGLIKVNDRIYLDKEEVKKDINIKNLKYNDMNIDLLSNHDKLVFIKYLKEMIFQSIEEWNELRIIANDIKHSKIDDVIEDCNNYFEKTCNDEEIIEGRNLLRMSIDEYKKELIDTYKKEKLIENDIKYSEIDNVIDDFNAYYEKTYNNEKIMEDKNSLKMREDESDTLVLTEEMSRILEEIENEYKNK